MNSGSGAARLADALQSVVLALPEWLQGAYRERSAYRAEIKRRSLTAPAHGALLRTAKEPGQRLPTTGRRKSGREPRRSCRQQPEKLGAHWATAQSS